MTEVVGRWQVAGSSSLQPTSSIANRICLARPRHRIRGQTLPRFISVASRPTIISLGLLLITAAAMPPAAQTWIVSNPSPAIAPRRAPS